MPFNPIDTILDFLQPVNKYVLSDDQGYQDNQLGNNIEAYETSFPSLDKTDIVIVGCSETRGAGMRGDAVAADFVRKELYKLYHWHKDVHIADAGNIRPGATLQDSYAALKTVAQELLQYCKKVVIIGGAHDLTLAQYNIYASMEKVIEATCVDALIDLNMNSSLPIDRFLMSMLTSSPNFIKHYNHIGFQSYFVHPDMLETIDKLRFDCFRVGKVKENMEEMEPVVRNAHLFSFDISAIQQAYAPANRISPNGLSGEEACMLMQYAGMSTNVSTAGIYGYVPELDLYSLTAKQISHMLWYLMDGMLKGKHEAQLNESNNFNEFKLAFAEVETTFLQSKKTGRWWMQLPDGNFIACSYNDYTTASQNEIPERWMRAVERS
ncbi:MAG TPA: formimidoylglutamase [Chitinophagaceae bacterium]